jgi:serine/threonine-protein kinase
MLIDSGKAVVPPLHAAEQGTGGEAFLYYVMPYVEGESLRDRLNQERQLSIDDAVQIAREVADALDYAHRQDVIHRDIKPENILLQEHHAVVADFGIARAVSVAASEELTQTGFALGTPAYMSIEQAVGERNVDGRSDIYSLGCVLYEMLGGDPPFTGSTPKAILARKTVEQVPSLRVVRETVPESLEQVVLKSLAKAPADRFATASDFARALTEASTTPAPARLAYAAARLRRWLVPLALLSALLVVGAGWWGFSRFSASAPRVGSLVVLPPENLSGDPEQEYFVAGMHDALIGELAQISALRVISRTSAMRYQDTDKSVPEIARELGVEAVVEASVLPLGDSVRIQAQLIQALPEERQLDAWSYHRHLRDVLAVHSEVARAIAREINVTVTGAEQDRLARARVVNPEAYRLYTLGSFQLVGLTEAAFRQAREHFEEAIDIDPSFAQAHAGLAMALIELGSWWSSLPPQEFYPQGRAAALKALELDSTVAEAHIALGRVKFEFDWDWAGADAAFRRGIALNPSVSYARVLYASYLMAMGRFGEAASMGRQTLEHDPVSMAAYRHLGWALDRLGQDDEALEHYQTALEMAPNVFPPYTRLVEFHLRRGRLEEASQYLERAESLHSDALPPVAMSHLAYYYARLGRRADALRVVRELETGVKDGYVLPLGPALVYVGLGQEEKALDFLERGFESRDITSVWNKMRWLWDPLRDEPRFQRLLERMDFPD